MTDNISINGRMILAPKPLMSFQEKFKRVSLYAVCVLRSPLCSPASLILKLAVFSLLL